MKRFLAVIMLVLCMLIVLTACKSEADMVETMVSDIVSDATMPTTTTTNPTNDNNGDVSDTDGVIGNETQETTTTMGNNS